MNEVYLYDGSFKQLITLIFTLIKHNKEPVDIKAKSDYVSNLLDKPTYLVINNVDKKMEYIKSALSDQVLIRLYYTYLSYDKNKELIMYSFIKSALKYKDDILQRRNIDAVNDVLKLSKRTSREAHKLKGFLRFKKMRNFYYAKINPTNNVIFIISNHFKKRLNGEYWLIHDISRKIYALYDLKKVIYLNEDEIIDLDLELSNDEEKFQSLWKLFFNTIGIKERENKKVQMNFMPKKYWENIIEMEDKS